MQRGLPLGKDPVLPWAIVLSSWIGGNCFPKIRSSFKLGWHVQLSVLLRCLQPLCAAVLMRVRAPWRWEFAIWGSSSLWLLPVLSKPHTFKKQKMRDKMCETRLTCWISPRIHVSHPCISEGFLHLQVCGEGYKAPWYTTNFKVIVLQLISLDFLTPV